MTKIALTGANGFLGQHVRAAAREYGIKVVGIPLGDGFSKTQARSAMSGASRVIHIAGINRGSAEEISEGNILFASQLATALDGLRDVPAGLMYANSIQSGNGTVYGDAKERASEILATAADRSNLTFDNVHLPNLFGEGGKPFYNSVVATFSHLVAQGEEPAVQQDKMLQLLHAQNAADILLGSASVAEMDELCHLETVSGLKSILEEFHKVYSTGEFPDISTIFRRDLFNTYRSYAFPNSAPLGITRHKDERGSFFEIVRSHGGSGQTSFSTTAPGVTRGNHFHRRKVERFTVLSGDAEISLRHLFSDRVYTYKISGEEPMSVDMPTLYAHDIRNVGTSMLYTAFWTNDIFDSSNPDTIPEDVQ